MEFKKYQITCHTCTHTHTHINQKPKYGGGVILNRISLAEISNQCQVIEATNRY